MHRPAKEHRSLPTKRRRLGRQTMTGLAGCQVYQPALYLT